MAADDRTAALCDPTEHPSFLPKVPIAPAAVERAAKLFRALGDGPRLRLMIRLMKGERCVTELAEAEGESLSTISQRLRVLHTEDIVVRRRRGKHINYALADRHIADLVANAVEHAGEPPRVSDES